MPQLLALWMLLVFSAVSLAKEPQPSTSPRSFVIAIEQANYPPHYDFDKKKQLKKSFAHDLFTAFGQSYDYEFKFKAVPWFVLKDNELEGYDFRYPDNPLWHKVKPRASNSKLFFSKPIVTAHYALLINPEDETLVEEHFSTDGSEKVLKVSIVEDYTPQGLEKAINGEQIILFKQKDTLSALRSTIKGKTKATFCDKAVAKELLLNKFSGKILVEADFLPTFTEAFYLSSNQHPNIIKEFNQFLGENKEFIAKLKALHGL